MPSSLVFDIETGPRPWAEVEPFYQPPPAMLPFNESMVKYGQLKDPAKRAEKLAEVKAKYEAELAAEAAGRDAHKCEWLSRAALSPLTGCVLAIGVKTERQTVTIGDDGENEEAMLEIFWGLFKKYNGAGGKLVGWNSNGFDVPFLVRRSWYLGVAVPDSILDRNPRYLCGTFVDLMQRWQLGQSGGEKLDTAARFLGIGGKPDDCDGAHFAAMWRSGDAASKQTALAYLRNDLVMTWKLAERMGVIS